MTHGIVSRFTWPALPAMIGDHDAFLEALVREHGPAHAVADGPDAFDAGPAMLVDDDAAAIVELDAGAVAERTRRVGATADRDEQLVDRERFVAVLVEYVS